MTLATFLMIVVGLAFILILKALSNSSKKRDKVYYVSQEPRPEYVVYDQAGKKQGKWEKRGIKFLILCAIVALFKLNKNTED